VSFFDANGASELSFKIISNIKVRVGYVDYG